MDRIILNNVSLVSSHVTLTDISLTVGEGRMFALLGLPETGKSQLLKVMMGIIEPDSGQIVLQGNMAQEQHNHMHYVPKIASLPTTLTVYEILRYYGLSGNKIIANLLDFTINDISTSLGLNDVRDKVYHQLSNEHQWCLQIAILALVKATVFLWDEPFHDLTQLQRKILFAHLKQLLPTATIIFTTISLTDALNADEGALLHDGRVVWNGDFEELVAHEMTAAYDLQVMGNTDYILPIIESLSWVQDIEYLTTGKRNHWRITVKNESHAEHDLLRAVLADNNLKINRFQLIRPRLKNVLDEIRSLENTG